MKKARQMTGFFVSTYRTDLLGQSDFRTDYF